MVSEMKMKVVVAGGGTAGWVAAATLSAKLGAVLDITLIESEEIGTVGVGESTIPPMRVFHKLLGINEDEFVAATMATYKLGISFENWKLPGENYYHSFGTTGKESWMAGFQHFWMWGRERGLALEFGDYCLELQAAKEGRFAAAPHSELNYAFHLDSSRYARFLRQLSEKNGAKRIEGKIKSVNLRKDDGFIDSLTLESGQVVEGELFLDCTGFRGLLIERALHVGYEDWSHWLPCDRAVVMQTESIGAPVPYTRAIAHSDGWRWRIPLQHRMGNGLVYSSAAVGDDVASRRLTDSIDGAGLNDPRVIRYRTGRRLKPWTKNCIALGLSSGFVEPLESTSIHSFITGVTRLLQFFPMGEISKTTVNEYNKLAKIEAERIRDFIILHYHLTQRDDSDFWRYCRNMEIPDSLRERIELFKETAMVLKEDGDLFRVDSWIQVMLGQGITPRAFHPLAKTMSDAELKQFLTTMRSGIEQKVKQLPTHQEFLERYHMQAVQGR